VKPPARAIVGNLVWSADGGVWAVWRVTPMPDAPASAARVRDLLTALPDEAMLLSVCARVDPWDIAAAMAEGVDLARHDAWASACQATVTWMEDVALFRRRHYLAVLLAPTRAPWRDLLRTAVDDVTAVFGLSPRPVRDAELDELSDQAERLERRFGAHVSLRAVDTGELCWLHARALRREASEPSYDLSWEPGQALAARTTDVVVVEGGYRLAPGDGQAKAGKPGHAKGSKHEAGKHDGTTDGDAPTGPLDGRYVRIDSPGGTAYQTMLALADLPQHVLAPDGGRPWLYDIGEVGFPVDWCIRLHGVEATVLLSVAAPSLAELEERAGEVMDGYAPREYGLARPVNGQLALLRSTLPGTAAAPACGRYRQRLDPEELAAAAPFRTTTVGDSHGPLLGLSLDGGTGAPVHLVPSSLAAVGSPGAGVSYLLKRLAWDAVARGTQVVVVDRSPDGEYVGFASAVPGAVQVVQVDPVAVLAEGADGARASLVRAAAGAGAESADLVVLWAPGAPGAPGHDPAAGPDDLDRDPDAHPDAAEAADEAAAALVGAAVDLLAAAPGRDGAVLVDDAMPVLARPEGRAALVDVLRRGPRRRTGLWLGCDTPALLESHDLVGITTWFVFDQLDEDIPAAMALLGREEDRAGGDGAAGYDRAGGDGAAGHDRAGGDGAAGHDDGATADAALRLVDGLDTGQCLVRDARGRVGYVQVLPPLLDEVQPAFEPDVPVDAIPDPDEREPDVLGVRARVGQVREAMPIGGLDDVDAVQEASA
jgi:hypothetical protein